MIKRTIPQWITAKTIPSNTVKARGHTLLLFAFFLWLGVAPSAWARPDVSLGETLKLLGLQPVKSLKTDPAESERYAGKNLPDVFAENKKPYITIGGVKVWLTESLILIKGNLAIDRVDYDKVLVPLIWRNKAPFGIGFRRIVIDPGHGGKDPGIVSKMYNYAEKSATLDTALRLKIILEKLGFEVLLTRDKDKFVDLPDRCDYANKVKADLFISLHFNGGAPKDSTTSGIETYCLTVAGESSTNHSKKTASSIMLPGNRLDALNLLLAWSVHQRAVNSTGTEDRAVKRARFAVLKSLNCPGILFEGGFISSQAEGAQIANPNYRQKLAESIAAGIIDYSNRLKP